MSTNPLVVLNLGKGSCQTGLSAVTAQLWLVGSTVPIKVTGSLPPAPELPELYGQWRSLYEALHARLRLRQPDPRGSSDLDSSASELGELEFDEEFDEIEFEQDSVTHVSEEEFRYLCRQLQQALNDWLNAPGFRNIDQQLRTKLAPTEAVRVIIETDDPLLQKLPWHLWRFCEHYSQTEIALSAQEYEHVVSLPPKKAHPVRILVILGHSDGLNIQHDRALLEQLPDADIVVLSEPQRSELDRWLWDETGWDILFFAGHSTSQTWQATGQATASGKLFINAVEQLSIEQLRNALRAAIARGLKLAIFNSCDGLGLARSLSDLNIPQMIVMREPVVDQVAQRFLKHFLQVFSSGNTLYSSVRQAREQLQGVESEFPGASWLPVLYQNPTETPMRWPGKLPRSTPPPPRRKINRDSAKHHLAFAQRLNLRRVLAASLIVALSVMGVRSLGWLQPSELSAYDRLMRSRPAQLEAVVDPHLLVVEITPDDTNEYGYPLNDDVLVNALETLQQYQPRAIGLDLHRYQARNPGRAQLIDQFQTYPNLFTVCSFGLGTQKIYGPPPEFSANQVRNQVGFSDLQTDEVTPSRSRTVRRQLLSYEPRLAAPSDCATPFSLSFHLAFDFLTEAGIDPIRPNSAGDWQFGPVTFHRLAARTGGYQNLNGQSHQILINYRFHPQPARRITFSEISAGTVEPNLIKDRIVLIGTTDPVGNDYFETPYGSMPGVWVHAHLVSQLLQAVLENRPLLWVLPQWRSVQWGDLLWVWVWSTIGGLLLWRLRSRLALGLAIGISAVVLYQICLFALIKGGWLPLVPALLALVLTAVSLAIYASVTAPQVFKSSSTSGAQV